MDRAKPVIVDKHLILQLFAPFKHDSYKNFRMQRLLQSTLSLAFSHFEAQIAAWV